MLSQKENHARFAIAFSTETAHVLKIRTGAVDQVSNWYTVCGFKGKSMTTAEVQGEKFCKKCGSDKRAMSGLAQYISEGK